MSETTVQTELNVYSPEKISAQQLPEERVVEKETELRAEFPFTWLMGKRAIVRIAQLSAAEKEKVEDKGKKVCSLCRSGEVEYEKTSGGVTHLICKNCALSYVQRAKEMQR
jgi:hypothetical protein